jgi:hypothetical protein
MPDVCFMSSQVDAKYTEASCNFIFMTLWILNVNFIEYFVFIIPVLGIIFYVLYKGNCDGEAYSVTHFSLMYLYLLPDDGQM